MSISPAVRFSQRLAGAGRLERELAGLVSARRFQAPHRRGPERAALTGASADGAAARFRRSRREMNVMVFSSYDGDELALADDVSA